MAAQLDIVRMNKSLLLNRCENCKNYRGFHIREVHSDVWEVHKDQEEIDVLGCEQTFTACFVNKWGKNWKCPQYQTKEWKQQMFDFEFS